MKKLLFIFLIPSLCYAEGPILKQTDPMKSTNVQQEFENVYKDLRSTKHLPGFSVTTTTGSTVAPATRTTSVYADTNLTATINLKYATSKVLIFINQSCDVSTSAATGSLKLQRNGSDIFGPFPYFPSIAAFQGITVPIIWYDAPNTIGNVTYKTQMALTTGAGTFTCQDSFAAVNVPSQIFIMEITQ